MPMMIANKCCCWCCQSERCQLMLLIRCCPMTCPCSVRAAVMSLDRRWTDLLDYLACLLDLFIRSKLACIAPVKNEPKTGQNKIELKARLSVSANNLIWSGWMDLCTEAVRQTAMHADHLEFTSMMPLHWRIQGRWNFIVDSTLPHRLFLQPKVDPENIQCLTLFISSAVFRLHLISQSVYFSAWEFALKYDSPSVL